MHSKLRIIVGDCFSTDTPFLPDVHVELSHGEKTKSVSVFPIGKGEREGEGQSMIPDTVHKVPRPTYTN